jgi:D-amino-acid dehydrogenase
MMNVHGGVWYKTDAHLSPKKLMVYLKEYLEKHEVEFILNSEVKRVKTEGSKITAVVCDEREISADQFVLANGAWSAHLAKTIGVNFSLLPGKGYSFSQKSTEKPILMPSILCEGKVAVTPMDGFTRFGGTMEITHVNDKKVNMNRVRGIVNTVNSFFPNVDLALPEMHEVWSGFRPCSSDGLPLIGKSNKFNNLIIATGHSMMGVSLAPATGKIIENMLNSNSQPINVKLFDPNR